MLASQYLCYMMSLAIEKTNTNLQNRSEKEGFEVWTFKKK